MPFYLNLLRHESQTAGTNRILAKIIRRKASNQVEYRYLQSSSNEKYKKYKSTMGNCTLPSVKKQTI
jgi:hypothetical protein